ncbi:polyprenyl synthetase family protein [Streptomyces sp. A1-5]|uniref:polyprenyl synthetase family protein n=1 Tax=Streptomyces sp. A1-5 TaxID=2738410 RepID=UPI001F28F456|nr:polyprenyl synthetase family protein [Streptomyces sp. A1-5]
MRGVGQGLGGAAEAVLPFAAGIECLHVASLIHDDIVDQDPVRRGRASIAEQFGIAEALLAGDGLSMAGHAAMLSGGPADRVPAATRVDLLPYTVHDRAAGKSAVSDVANRQPTLPVLLAYEAAGEADRQRLVTISADDVDPVTAHRDVLDMVTHTGAVTEAARQARTYIDDAHAELDALPAPGRLAEPASSVVARHP